MSEWGRGGRRRRRRGRIHKVRERVKQRAEQAKCEKSADCRVGPFAKCKGKLFLFSQRILNLLTLVWWMVLSPADCCWCCWNFIFCYSCSSASSHRIGRSAGETELHSGCRSKKNRERARGREKEKSRNQFLFSTYWETFRCNEFAFSFFFSSHLLSRVIMWGWVWVLLAVRVWDTTERRRVNLSLASLYLVNVYLSLSLSLSLFN